MSNAHTFETAKINLIQTINTHTLYAESNNRKASEILVNSIISRINPIPIEHQIKVLTTIEELLTSAYLYGKDYSKNS